MGRGTKAAICVKGDSSKHPYIIILYLVHSTDESKLEIFFIDRTVQRERVTPRT